MKASRPTHPELLFRWRGWDGTPIPGLLALALVLLGFAGAFAVIRVPVKSNESLLTTRASVLFLGEDGEDREWALKAREGGPFPSRFEPSQWAAEQEPRQLTLEHSLPPYRPELRSLPEEPLVKPPPLSRKGESVFPHHAAPSLPRPPAPAARIRPQLYPLTPVEPRLLPRELPEFSEPVDAAMRSAPWRFLLRLEEDGRVRDCISLAGPNEANAAALTSWLCRIRFSEELARRTPWIACAVIFTNEVNHGTDSH